MSKRALITIILGILVIAFLVLINLGWNLPLLGLFEPEFTKEIPEKRPPRLDRRELARFEGMSMEEILTTLTSEKTLPEPGVDVDPVTREFLASLPEDPVPFHPNSSPRNEKWLREFVTSFQAARPEAPTEDDLRKFNLALSALHLPPDQIPESLQGNGVPTPESDTLPVTLEPVPHDFSGVFAVGEFAGDRELAVIDRGGLRMSAPDESGALAALAVSPTTFPGHRLVPADFDHDGDTDLLVLRGNGFPDSLLRNEGAGSFRDVTIELGLLAFRDSTDAAWLDYDGDGLLDLLSGSSDHPLELYHQTEGGGFQQVAWDLKLWVPRGIRQIEIGDFSGDGRADLFLGIDGYQDRFCRTTPAETWSEWRFPDVTAETSLNPDEDSQIVFFDFDADGRSDILTLPPVSAARGPRLFHARPDGSFLDVSDEIEISGFEGIRSATPIDIDNDGYLDLFCGTDELHMNQLLWNRGGLSVKEISIAGGASFLDCPSQSISLDFDRDGVSELIYLDTTGGIRWLKPTGDVRDWLRVTVKNARTGVRIVTESRDGDWIVHRFSRELSGSESVLIGLGDSDVVESVSLYAPSQEEPLSRQEKLEPNQEILFELPREPKKRAVAPL